MEKAKLISLPVMPDVRGNLSVVEQQLQVPFCIRRVYWIYDVPGGTGRGGHAYRSGCELIVALSGSFDVLVDDGVDRACYTLNRSYIGLYVPAGYWRELLNFSTNSVAMVISSTPYDEADYIRDYHQFLNMRAHERD